MKTLGIEQATLDSCVREAQDDRVLLTRDGRPVAVVVGVAGLDDEQIALGMSDGFWRLITARSRASSADVGSGLRLSPLGVVIGSPIAVQALRRQSRDTR